MKKPGEFKLILINNRDEFFHRPSNSASFVTNENIYACDKTPGKAGGTWLGVSKYGRVGVLLNLSSKTYPNDPMALGRGFIVPNYLNHREGLNDYIKNLRINSASYNPFNLVLYEKNSEDLFNSAIFNNYDSTFLNNDSSFLCISNHLFDKPYIKTQTGQSKFENIVTSYGKVAMKNVLVNKLLELLKDGNNILANDGTYVENEVDVTDKIFVNYPNYGTRTHTIILVDDKNKVYYQEHTLELLDDRSNPKWTSQNFEFDLFNYTKQNTVS